MTREELRKVSARGPAFFDRIQLWLDFETGEKLKEIYRVERIIDYVGRYDPKIDGRCGIFDVPSEYWMVRVLTEDGTEKDLEIHNAMFGPAYKPFLGAIFLPEKIGRALYEADQRKPPDQRKAGI